MIGFLTVLGWIAVGVVSGCLLTRHYYHGNTINVGRASRGPVCTSCPFVTDAQRHEILHGRPTELPPARPLPVLDGSGLHRPAV